MVKLGIIIEKLRYPEELPGYLDLYHTVFGKAESEEFFKWKYILNPCQTDKESYNIVVAKDGRKIVGARANFPSTIWCGGTAWRAVQSGDTMVHPDYRGQGIFSKMVRFSVDDLQEKKVQLIFNFPNKNSFQGYIKLGWHDQWQVKQQVKIIRPLSLAHRKLKRTTKATVPPTITDWSYDKLRLSSDVPEGAQELFGRAFGNNGQAAQMRTTEWLHWRYVISSRKRYWFISMEDRGALLGYAIVSLSHSGTGDLVDYVVEDNRANYFSHLLKGASSWFSTQKATHVKSWCAHKNFTKVFSRNLFVPVKQPLNFVTRYLDNGFPQDASWYITMGDTDTF